MKALRFRMRLESTTLDLPELKIFVGKDVEIVVLEDEEAGDELDVGERLLETLEGPVRLHEDLDPRMPQELLRRLDSRPR